MVFLQQRSYCFVFSAATCQASDIEGVSHGYYRVEAGNNITQSTVDFNTIVKFECDPGYELRGSLRTHCRENGWSDPKPECTRKFWIDPNFVTVQVEAKAFKGKASSHEQVDENTDFALCGIEPCLDHM